MAQRYSWGVGIIKNHGLVHLVCQNHFLSKKNGEEIWDKFLNKFKQNPNIIRREIPNPFSPITNLEIDAPTKEKKEIGGEKIPKRRRSGRRIKTTEPVVPLK